MKNAPPQDITRLKAEYDHLRKLTKVAAEKARNAWWSERATEAERRALVAEQQGRGGSLIRDLHLFGKKFSKPASSSLVAKDGSVLQSDGDKLNCWAEHFQEVVTLMSFPLNTSPLSPHTPHLTQPTLTMTCPPPSLKRSSLQYQSIVSESALHCSHHPDCSFLARNQAGLTNHQQQRHFTIQIIQCQYCHQTFHQQRLHNHQRFCQSRLPAT